MIWLRTLLTVLVPATLSLYLPGWIVSRTGPMAAVPIALGASLYLWCAVVAYDRYRRAVPRWLPRRPRP